LPATLIRHDDADAAFGSRGARRFSRDEVELRRRCGPLRDHFSDVSLRAVEYALLLAREADAQLVLAHVVEGVIDQAALASTPHLPVADYVRDRALEATVRLQALIPDEARIWSRPETRVASGRASRELVGARQCHPQQSRPAV
jgi:hypothetical protein